MKNEPVTAHAPTRGAVDDGLIAEVRAGLEHVGWARLPGVLGSEAHHRAAHARAAESPGPPTPATSGLLADPLVLRCIVELSGPNIWAIEAEVVVAGAPRTPPRYRCDLQFALTDLAMPEPPRLGIGVLFVLGDVDGEGGVCWSLPAVPGRPGVEVRLTAGDVLIYDGRLRYAEPTADGGSSCRYLRAVYGPRWLGRNRPTDDWRRVAVDDPLLAQIVDAPGISRVSDIGVSNRYNPFDQALPLAGHFDGVLPRAPVRTWPPEATGTARTAALDLPLGGLTPDERRRFEADGLVVLPDALSSTAAERLADIARSHWRADHPIRGLEENDRYDRYDLLTMDRAFLELIDHPRALGAVTTLLGSNIYCYINHFSVLPPSTETSSLTYFSWLWHLDNQQLATDLALEHLPRFDLKVAWILTDLTRPDRGNTWFVPGSHRSTERPPQSEDAPHLLRGARPVCARPGSIVVMDPRVWHTATPNESDVTRVVLWIGYGYRWMQPRGDRGDLAALGTVRDPARRRLIDLTA